jgi:hypothetical protein
MVFPIITGSSGALPILAGLPDIDLELVDSRLFDGACSSSSTSRPSLRAISRSVGIRSAR